jgi:non-ribosomal peptide synthetase component F
VNTCLDLNERFDVGASDRVLALSSISFDLSVYDVFGLLGAGASLVVPPHDLISPPDPEIWLEIVSSHQICCASPVGSIRGRALRTISSA